MKRPAPPDVTRPWLHPTRLAFLVWLLAHGGAPVDAKTGSRAPRRAGPAPAGRYRVHVADNR